VKKPVWIEEHDVLILHQRLLALDGGAAGVRSQALLQSALARPKQLHAYGDTPDTVAMAALYVAGLVKNHPFVDGNKRVGFLTGVLFLELNGRSFTATEEEATQAVLALAAGSLSEPEFTEWLRIHCRRS
jgi:death on curing protein